MISPYKLSATQGIGDFRLPIVDLKNPKRFLQIGNRQLAIGNSLGC